MLNYLNAYMDVFEKAVSSKKYSKAFLLFIFAALQFLLIITAVLIPIAFLFSNIYILIILFIIGAYKIIVIFKKEILPKLKDSSLKEYNKGKK